MLDKDFVWECDYGARGQVINTLGALLDAQNANELRMVALFVNNNPYTLEFFVVLSYANAQAHQIPEMRKRLSALGLRYRPDLTLGELLAEVGNKRFNSSFYIDSISLKRQVDALFWVGERSTVAQKILMNPLGKRAPVFLSHASVDKPEVEELLPFLNAANLPAWYDKISIDYGQSLVTALQEGVEHSAAVIFWITRAFLNSRWCNTEMRNFINRHSGQGNVLILSIVAEDISIHELPFFLRELKCLQRTSGMSVGEIAQEILPTLKQHFTAL